MHGHSHMRHEWAPIHQSTHTAPNGMRKALQRAKRALAIALPLWAASCTVPPQQYHAPTAQRAIGMSPMTLSFAINQAQQQRNPQMAIDALVNYARTCKTPLGPQWLNYARYQLALARAHGGKLTPEQEKLMILWLYSQEKALPPIDNRFRNDGTAQIDAPAEEALPA